MIDFNMPPERRLENWQEFRTSLSDQDEITQLESVAKYWSLVPINPWYLDDDQPETWPTPWEIIFDGEYCPTTVSYLMQETLHLANVKKWVNSRFSLKLIKDLDHAKMQVVLVVDDEWTLNYSWSKVDKWCDIKQQVIVINTILK